MDNNADHLPSADEERAKLTAEALAAHDGPTEHKHGDADSESDLSELDDNVFKDYNTALPINNRPVVPIDEEAVAKLGVHRRQRDPNEVANDRPATHKRIIKRRRRDEGDEEELGGGRGRMGGTGKKHSKGGEGVDRQKPARILTTEEQRRADLNAKMDDAVKSKTKRRKKKDEVVCSLAQIHSPSAHS